MVPSWTVHPSMIRKVEQSSVSNRKQLSFKGRDRMFYYTKAGQYGHGG